MNIEYANRIAVSEILNKIGSTPVKSKGHEHWYFSPFRKEKTPSFHVNTQKNVWYDFGEGAGGDAIRLVCKYLEHSGVLHSPKEALRWLRNMFQGPVIPAIPNNPDSVQNKDLKSSLKSVKPLKHPALLHYLASRGIPTSLARTCLQEIRIKNAATGNIFFAAGIKNEEGGYEYRNLYFKGCVGKKSITFVRGEIPKPPAIHIFEGFMDFLSVLAERKFKKLRNDAIVLNSLTQMNEAAAYIREYGYETAYTWFDNDEAGKKATEAFAEFTKTEPGLKHQSMNRHYASYKDVNAAHMAKLRL